MEKSSGVRGIGAELLPYVVTTAMLMVGCADEPAGPQDVVVIPVAPVAPVDLHFEDGYIAVMFDAVLVDVWAGGQIDFGCPECAQRLSEIISEVIITAETPTTITATFHDALGNLLVKGFDDYQFTLTPLDPELLRFTRTGAFAGMLMRIAPGPTVVEVALYNVLTQTFDFGPFPVPVMAE